MSKIVLASHGKLSMGMLHSTKMIVGNLACDIETYSLNPGENPNDYAQELKKRIQEDEQEYIIVCDIKGGSVYNAMVPLCQYHNVSLLSGMNMNMILELVIAKNVDMNQVIQSSKDGITYENETTINKEIVEDDF